MIDKVQIMKTMVDLGSIALKTIDVLELKGIFKSKDEYKDFEKDWNKGFYEYLSRSWKKYSKIKTLMFRHEPKPIYEFFVPPYLKKREELIETSNIKELLKISNFLIITGIGGAGKSTLLKHLFINSLEQFYNLKLIPIFIELKDLNDLEHKIDLNEIVLKMLETHGRTIQAKHLDYALSKDRFVFLLDGYDELPSDVQDAFFLELNRFYDRYPKNYYILTSRPITEFVEHQRFTVLETENLNLDQAISLISKIEPFDQELKNKFINDLQENLFNSHYEFASNPLLLNIMLLTYEYYAEVPGKRYLFYQNAFETLYRTHDTTKGAFKRTFESNLAYDDFVRVLAHFSFLTFKDRKIEFSQMEFYEYLEKVDKAKRVDVTFDKEGFLHDIVNNVCLLYKEGLNYRYIHRSFQEYFTAVFLKDFPDELLAKTTKMIVKHVNKSLSFQENVWSMLKSMIPERYEKNVLLPILEDFDQRVLTKFGKRDVESYFLSLFNGISFRPLNKAGLYEIYVIINDRLLCDNARVYRPRNTEYITEVHVDEISGLLDKNNKKKPLFEYRFSNDQILANQKLYELIKKSWVWELVETLYNLGDTIRKKHAELNELTLLGLDEFE